MPTTGTSVAVVIPRQTGGRPLSGGRPAQTATLKISRAEPPGGRTADPLWPGEIGSEIGLGFSRVVFVAPLHRLYFL